MARNSSSFVAKSWNRYGCETPTLRAIAWVEVPAYPVAANSIDRGGDHGVAAFVGGELLGGRWSHSAQLSEY